MIMRSALSFVSGCLAVLGLSACGSAREQAQTGTNFCFNCHSETSALGIKIKWAEAGYAESRHGVGALNVDTAPTPPPSTGGICPPFVQPTAATCTGNGGTVGTGATATICTMPATTTPTQCALAGGLFSFSGVSTPPCLPFVQAAALQGPPSATISPNNCSNIFGAAAYVSPLCTPPTGATQSGCEAAGGTWNGAKTTIVGYEREGSRSFNLNGFGCQICHTQEGWRDRLSGAYDTANLKVSYDPKAHTVSWDPSAWYTKDTVTLFVPNGVTNSVPALPASVSPLAADTIVRPSPLGCFGCHTPHGIGTTDNVTLDQTIPPGTTAVTTMAGSIWGNASTPIGKGTAPKDKGQICASCHQIRLNQFTSVSSLLVKTIQGAPPYTASPSGTIPNPATGQPYPFSQTTFSFPNPHDSPTADMLLGNGGAEYAAGTVIRTGAGAPSALTFGGTYTSSAHATLAGADCVSCHMQSDYSDFDVTNRFGLSPAVGGHSFANKGIVFGNAAASPFGCGSCHTVANVVGSTGTAVVASRIGASTNVKPSPTASFGYLQVGFPVLLKGNDSGVIISSNTVPSLVNFKDSQYHLKLNEILMKLANPDTGCDGLFKTAGTAAGFTVSSSYTFGVIWGPGGACGSASVSGTGAALDPAAVDDGTNNKVRLAKANWNFSFVLNDQSFGGHNIKYAGQLLYDSCVDLAVMAGKPCTSATSCESCNGTFVTSRASF
jgi:hypothetical protein